MSSYSRWGLTKDIYIVNKAFRGRPTESCLITGVDKFLSKRSVFRAGNFTCAPDRACKKNGPSKPKSLSDGGTLLRETFETIETLLSALYNLNSTYSFYF